MHYVMQSLYVIGDICTKMYHKTSRKQLLYLHESEQKQKQKKPQTKRQRCENIERSGVWGGSEGGMAITGSDEGQSSHYWQRSPL